MHCSEYLLSQVLTTSWQSWWNSGRIPFPPNYSAVEGLLSRLVLADQIHYSTLDKEIGLWPTRTKKNTEEKAKYTKALFTPPHWNRQVENLNSKQNFHKSLELKPYQVKVEPSELLRLNASDIRIKIIQRILINQIHELE